jgi:hypothetical protein
VAAGAGFVFFVAWDVGVESELAGLEDQVVCDQGAGEFAAECALAGAGLCRDECICVRGDVFSLSSVSCACLMRTYISGPGRAFREGQGVSNTATKTATRDLLWTLGHGWSRVDSYDISIEDDAVGCSFDFHGNPFLELYLYSGGILVIYRQHLGDEAFSCYKIV